MGTKSRIDNKRGGWTLIITIIFIWLVFAIAKGFRQNWFGSLLADWIVGIIALAFVIYATALINKKEKA